MECPKCQSKLPEGSKFCLECGGHLNKPKELLKIDFQQPQTYGRKDPDRPQLHRRGS